MILVINNATADQTAALQRALGRTNDFALWPDFVNSHCTSLAKVWTGAVNTEFSTDFFPPVVTQQVEPTMTVTFVDPGTFSVDDWGPHTEGSVATDSDMNCQINLAWDLEAPLLWDVVMHMAGHWLIDLLTQFDGPKDELTTAVHGTDDYWDVSGDNVQEGICEAFKDLALQVGRDGGDNSPMIITRGRDTLSRFRVTRDTIDQLATTLATDFAWSWPGRFWGWRPIDLIDLHVPIVHTVDSTFTPGPVVAPYATYDPGNPSANNLVQYSGHIWYYYGGAWPYTPIGGDGWVDYGPISDWTSKVWPLEHSSSVWFTLSPVRFGQYWNLIMMPAVVPPAEGSAQPIPNFAGNAVGHKELVMATASSYQSLYLNTPDGYSGFQIGSGDRHMSAPPRGAINGMQWAYGSALYSFAYIRPEDADKLNSDGLQPAGSEPPAERIFGNALSGGVSWRANQAMRWIAPWPYGGRVAAGDFTSGMLEFPH